MQVKAYRFTTITVLVPSLFLCPKREERFYNICAQAFREIL